MLGISPKRVGISPKNLDVSSKTSGFGEPMSASTITSQFQEMVRQEVGARRAIGLKGAFREVARLYSLTERRVRAAWHGELRSVRAEEWESVRVRRLEMLRVRQEQLRQELASLEEEFAASKGGEA